MMRNKYKKMKLPNNIILFPKEKIAYPERVGNMDVIEMNVTVANHQHINNTLEDVFPVLLAKLEEHGFIVGDCDDKKDAAFVFVALRSLMLKRYDIDHPFQLLAQKIFNELDNGELQIAAVTVSVKK